jgi:glycosyltransferase involved in cell wall biosynthesis
MDPLSIVLPVRNGMNFLVQSKRSLESNLGPRDEIILINDGSTDGTGDFLRNWSHESNQVNLITGPGRGLVAALNLGIRESSNSWIARFDVDDEYPSERLSLQRAAINPDSVAIFSDYEFWGSGAPNLGIIPSPIDPHATSVSLIASQRTAHPSVIFNKFAFNEVGMFRNEDFPAEDLSLWLRLTRVGKIYSLPKVLLRYQLTPNSITSLQRQESIKKTKKLIEEIGIYQSDIDGIFVNIENIIDLYRNSTLGLHRKILMLRELGVMKEAGLLTASQSKILRNEKAKITLDIRSYGIAFQIINERRLRRNFRKVIIQSQ